jgi:hypothetical protein
MPSSNTHLADSEHSKTVDVINFAVDKVTDKASSPVASSFVESMWDKTEKDRRGL